MPTTDRARLASLLRMATGAKNDTELMNYLQNSGLVSDNAVTIDDVAEADLSAAIEEVTK